MTRYFLEEGNSVPVTVLKIGPCVVIQKKTVEKEGYNAIQVGYGSKKSGRVNKPLQGHFKAAGDQSFSFLNEIRVRIQRPLNLGRRLNPTFSVSAI